MNSKAKSTLSRFGLLSLTLSLVAPTANAWVAKPKAGQVFAGTLIRHGKNTGKPCKIAIVKRAARPELGHHCFELAIEAPSFIRAETTLVSHVYYTAPVKSCAVGGADDLSDLSGGDSRGISTPTAAYSLGNRDQDPVLTLAFSRSGKPISLSLAHGAGSGVNLHDVSDLSCEDLSQVN